MSHKMLRPFIVNLSVLGVHFPLLPLCLRNISTDSVSIGVGQMHLTNFPATKPQHNIQCNTTFIKHLKLGGKFHK